MQPYTTMNLPLSQTISLRKTEQFMSEEWGISLRLNKGGNKIYFSESQGSSQLLMEMIWMQPAEWYGTKIGNVCDCQNLSIILLIFYTNEKKISKFLLHSSPVLSGIVYFIYFKLFFIISWQILSLLSCLVY